jgi:Spy/CpxP family protein refolding chaperone
MRTTSKRLIIGAAGAVLAAAVLFPFVAAAQEAQAPPPPRRERPAMMHAREALELTPEQEKALAEFHKARIEERRAFRDEMFKLRSEMRGLAQDPKANQAKLDALIDKTSKLRAGREKAAFRNRIERDKIFTPEQLEKMKVFRERLAFRQERGWRGPMGRGRMAPPRARYHRYWRHYRRAW